MPRMRVFVAFASKDEALSTTIVEAVRHANARTGPVHYEPWVYNDIPGRPLTSPILKNIEDSPFVIADITYLNLNVIYEVGFAIGRRKRVFLVRHKKLAGDSELAKKAGIFDTLGYEEYENFEELRDKLTSHIEETPLPIPSQLNRKAPVYVVEPPKRTLAETTLVSRVKKAGYRYRSFSPIEDARLSANDAIRQVSASAGVVLILQNPSAAETEIHNVRTMFVAGLAHGLEKPTLLICHANDTPPLDVRDIAKRYRRPNNIGSHVAEFCPEINAYLQNTDPDPVGPVGPLQSLTLGDPTAENEMTTLGSYYLKTDQYQKALRGEVNLVVGRKGSGKTALFIQVRDKLRNDRRNVVIDLRPEAFQLTKLKEDVLSYLADGAQQHLITAFWEYILLLEVAYKILENDQNIFLHNHDIRDAYLALSASYRAEDFSSVGDFSERLLALSKKLGSKYAERFGQSRDQRLTSADVTALLYTHELKDLKHRISEYLNSKDAVWVLFDNLDKSWSTLGIDTSDTAILRSLLDAARKLQRDMRQAGHKFHCIIFVRNDVYEHLVQKSPDFGKEMRVSLDWTDPDLLREIVRLRLAAPIADKKDPPRFDQLWSAICVSHIAGEESASYMIERSLMRPRNLLKIISHCRGFAINFSHTKIEREDVEKGLRAYSQDLLVELDRELSDVFPAAKDVIYHLIDMPRILSKERLYSVLTEAGILIDQHDRVVDFLLYYGVIGIHTTDKDYYIFEVNYDLTPLKIRAGRAGRLLEYTINPAFWPALGISSDFDAPSLPLS